MEDEEGYTTLNLRLKKGGSAGPSPAANQGAHQRPHWPLVVLGIGNIILAVVVLLLAVCVSQLVSKTGQTLTAPDSEATGSKDTSTPPGNGDTGSENCNTYLEHFRSNLTKLLCHLAQPGPPGGAGCKLCPVDWRLHGDTCYWVSRDDKTWNKSHTDCSERGSRLLVIRDRQELETLKDLTQSISQFWVRLSHSTEKGWTWLDGSRLDQSLFQVSGQAEGRCCGTVKGNQIHWDGCGSAYHWICQQDAILL